MNIEAKLGLDVFALDKQAHIVVDQKVCRTRCRGHACLTACPAHLYTVGPDGEVVLNYEGCLECGTCKLACPEGALDWRYPRGGFGVHFRLT